MESSEVIKGDPRDQQEEQRGHHYQQDLFAAAPKNAEKGAGVRCTREGKSVIRPPDLRWPLAKDRGQSC